MKQVIYLKMAYEDDVWKQLTPVSRDRYDHRPLGEQEAIG